METIARSTQKGVKIPQRPHHEDELRQAEPHVKKLITERTIYSSETYQQLIDIKKQRHESDKSRAKLFFAIGLVISLLAVITAFEWQFVNEGPYTELQAHEMDRFEETLDIPNTTQPPPPPPENNQAPVIVEVDDEVIIEEVEINLDVEMTENTKVEETVYEMNLEVEEEKAEEIFTIVEQRPQPVGGISAFYAYVAENLKYPSEAERNGIQGKVYLKFVVSKDGTISDVEVLKGIGFGCDKEAVKIIENSPKWVPGKQRGQPVNVYMTLPIAFVLK